LAVLIKQSEGEKRGRVSSARGKMTSFFAVRSLLLLSLGPIASWGGLPSFLVTMEEEWHYHKCDPAMCWWTTFDIEIDSDYSVPNSSLMIADYDWDCWEVRTSSLLEECAPALPLSQIAYSFSACKGIKDEKIEEACTAMQRGWIDEKGAINKVFLQETYSAVTLKAQTFINQCLVLEGNGVSEVEEIFNNYDYSDYYDYYDYGDNEVDEKSGGRKSRSVDDGKLRSRVKQRQEQRAGRRGRGGNRTKRRKEQINGKGKGNDQKGRKGLGKKKANKGRKRGNRKRKGKKEKRKEKESKKKKNNTKKEERRTLKKIGLKKAPSQLVLAQVKCIWLAVDLALEDCGKNILKASKIGHD